jgi:hypothetical protein
MVTTASQHSLFHALQTVRRYSKLRVVVLYGFVSNTIIGDMGSLFLEIDTERCGSNPLPSLAKIIDVEKNIFY